MQVSTPRIQAIAMRRMNALMARAAQHWQTAIGRPGDVRNLTLASMIDTIADEGSTQAATYVDLLDVAGDTWRSAAVTDAWTAAFRTLNGQALDCRMNSFRSWSAEPATAQRVAA